MVAALVAFPLTACVKDPVPAPLDVFDGSAVVALSYDGRVACTGAVIAPRAVLTAAHCVTPRAPDGVAVAGGSWVGVRAVRPLKTYREDELADDVAVVLLDEDAHVAPLPYATDPGRDPVGEIRARFFGAGTPHVPAGGPRDAGVATVHSGRVRVNRATDDGAWLLRPGPDQPCSGDSGGPLLDDGGRIVGVVSHGDVACASRAYATRLSMYAGAVEKLLAGDRPAPRRSHPLLATMAISALVAGVVTAFRRRRRPLPGTSAGRRDR